MRRDHLVARRVLVGRVLARVSGAARARSRAPPGGGGGDEPRSIFRIRPLLRRGGTRERTHVVRPRALHPTRALFLRERRHRVRRVRSRHAASRRIAARRGAETAASAKTRDAERKEPRDDACDDPAAAVARAMRTPEYAKQLERLAAASRLHDSAARGGKSASTVSVFEKTRATMTSRTRAAFRFASPRITPFVSTRSVGWRWGMATRVSSRRWRSVDRGRRGRSGGNRARCSPSRRTIGSS